MQTDRIRVTSGGGGARQAMDETVKFSQYVGLDAKAALWLRLLTEETLGMVEAITEDFAADYWIESVEGNTWVIHLTATTIMNIVKKQELIDASTNKKNAAAKGFMGKIRQVIENSLYSIDEVGSLKSEYDGTPLMFGEMGMCATESSSSLSTASYYWSLERYRHTVEEEEDTNKAAKAAWDELEKSIVANIADEVMVGVKGDTVELTITKKYR